MPAALAELIVRLEVALPVMVPAVTAVVLFRFNVNPFSNRVPAVNVAVAPTVISPCMVLLLLPENVILLYVVLLTC